VYSEYKQRVNTPVNERMLFFKNSIKSYILNCNILVMLFTDYHIRDDFAESMSLMIEMDGVKSVDWNKLDDYRRKSLDDSATAPMITLILPFSVNFKGSLEVFFGEDDTYTSFSISF